MNENIYDKSIAIANAIEVTALVCKEIAGNDISTKLNNSPMTLDTLRMAASAVIQNELTKSV
jgi:hypothetical protein